MAHSDWPRSDVLDLLGIRLPIVQAPMAGAQGSALAIAVSEAGGLGSLPCALLNHDQVRAEYATIRAATSRPVNLNFFCHHRVGADDAKAASEVWRRRLSGFYAELSIADDAPVPTVDLTPFDAATCELVEELRPDVVSFHFGLPDADLVARVRKSGATVMSSATTVDEAGWLCDRGCDVVIAQGAEAGGHRAMFLDAEITDVATQVGTMALVPQIVDAVDVPVIAAGGIADGRGIAAAFALGASGVQIGTAFLFTPEASTSPLHGAALRSPEAARTALTNVLTGRPARSIETRLMRELGHLSPDAPPFPGASGALVPLRATAEQNGDTSFTSLWSGQAARLARELPAGELTKLLADEAHQCLLALRPSDDRVHGQ
jgi:nitronate monooxygenase